MALTQEETQRILEMKQSGASKDEVYAEIGRMRATPLYASPIAKSDSLVERPTAMGDFIGDVTGAISGAARQYGGGIQRSSEVYGDILDGKQNPIAGGLMMGTEVVSGMTLAGGELLLGAAKAFPPEEAERDVANWIGVNVADPIMQQPEVQDLMEKYKWLEENDPAEFREVRALFAGAGILAETLGLGAGARTLKAGARTATTPVGSVVGDAVGTTLSSATKGTDLLSTAATTLKRRGTNTIDSVRRRVDDIRVENARIRASDPIVGEAIKADVPDAVINLSVKADDAQKEVYREIVGAYKAGDQEAISNTFSRVATEQYDIVDAKRSSIGSQIGETIETLPGGTVNFRPVVDSVRGDLEQIGFRFDDTGKLTGSRRSGMSAQEEAWVKEIYSKLYEYGDDITWQEMTDLDSLLSRINREAYQAGVTPPRIKVPNEAGELTDTNLTTYLRDTARGQLETVAPELRDLNNQYRKAVQFQEALDQTLFNAGRDLGITMDVGAPAQNRLRRIFSNAQTAEQYKAIARMLDDEARANGYTGPNLELMTDFNLRVQPLYPETIKAASLPGGIREAVGRFVTGEVDPRKTQEALENLVNQGKTPEAPTAAATAPNPKESPDVPSVNTTIENLDKKMTMELTKERGAIGAPSDATLIKEAKRRLKAEKNELKREELRKFIIRKETKKIAELMDGRDYLVLENYVEKSSLREAVTFAEMERTYNLLEAMGYKPISMSQQDVDTAIINLAANFEANMKKVPVTSE